MKITFVHDFDSLGEEYWHTEKDGAHVTNSVSYKKDEAKQKFDAIVRKEQGELKKEIIETVEL